MAETPQEELQVDPELIEGYPHFYDVVKAILADDRVPNGHIRRLEVNTFASNEVTYNVWYVGVDEPQGNHLELGRT